jgi:hypothetical protein
MRFDCDGLLLKIIVVDKNLIDIKDEMLFSKIK